MRFLFGMALGVFVGFRISQRQVESMTLKSKIDELKSKIDAAQQRLQALSPLQKLSPETTTPVVDNSDISAVD